MDPKTYGIDWSKIVGGKFALKYARRELANLETVMKLTPGRTAAVQAGGNLGVWPKRLAQRFQTVYTFEPSPELFPLMVANAPEPNIIRFQAALGVERQLVGVSRERRDGKVNHNHEGITHVSGQGVIPTILLDDLALPVCDLLYLDVEGYELYGLMGAEDTLRRCRPVVAVEINKNAAFLAITPQMVRSFLEALNYRELSRISSDVVFLPAERAA